MSIRQVKDDPAVKTLRLGSVSYLNAKPLIYGLEQYDDLELALDVPSRLLEDLEGDFVDIALLPVIDYQRMDGLVIVPSGGIGSDGETLTVRNFSKSPIEQITTLACDTDSHTSVALARIILAERFSSRPEFVPLNMANTHEARLLIGDKVITDEPKEFHHQLDLGQAWRELTGMPFVFAVWIAREGVDLRDLPQRLERAKREGLAHIDPIIELHALSRGWPADVARRYLTHHLQFDVGSREQQGIRLFHELAAKHELIPNPPKPLRIYGE
jgi:chorismate dehydratase